MRDAGLSCVGAFRDAVGLLAAYRLGEVSPEAVTAQSLQRIALAEPELGAMVSVMEESAAEQARASAARWRAGEARPLEGVPVSIKDTFDLAGEISTRGSRVFQNHIAYEDSGVVARLRAAGAVLVGKTNTAEFGQSATSENRLGPVTRNPWNPAMTPGGSSGGAAVSVAAGYVPLALGADGGGSIRIPAAMTGTVGFKPTYGLCEDERGFRGMSDFCCPGPFANTVADARLFLSVLAEQPMLRAATGKRRIGYCARPVGHPVEAAIQQAVETAAGHLAALGHEVEAIELDLSGWNEAFGPLVLLEEWRERGHLLDLCPTDLTQYELGSLEASRSLTVEMVERARLEHARYRAHVAAMFSRFDTLLLPTTATRAFPIDTRPREIEGQKVGRLWGAFPFTSPFNVAGNPAAALPAGVADGLPLSVQLVGPVGQDAALLDLAEDLEAALGFAAQHLAVAA